MKKSVANIVGGMLVGMTIATGTIVARAPVAATSLTGNTLPMQTYSHWSPGKGGGAIVQLGNGIRMPGTGGFIVPRVGGPGIGPLILDAQLQYKTKVGDTLIRVKATLLVDGSGCCGQPIDPVVDVVSEYVTAPQFVKADEHINTVVPLFLDYPRDEERPLAAWINVERYDEVKQIWRSQTSCTVNISKSS
jgi:hypothetical protein